MSNQVKVTSPPKQSLQPTIPVMKGLLAASEVASEAEPHSIRVTPPPMQSLQPTMPLMKGLQAASEVLRHDPAKLHPVFFTDTLQRTPGQKDVAIASPVALGYGYPKGGPKL